MPGRPSRARARARGSAASPSPRARQASNARPSCRPRSFSACWNSTSLLSKPRAIRLQYPTGMHDGRELTTRWPALDVAAKRARLINSLRLSAGLVDTVASSAAASQQAAAALWRGDPSAWGGDAATQREIAERLGWMRSPALMADSIDRLETFADGVKRDGFTDIVLLGMGGSSLAPEVLRAVIGGAAGLAATAHAGLDRSGRSPRSGHAARAARCICWRASPARRSSRTRSRRISASGSNDAGIAAWADHFVAITDDGTELARRARAERFRDTLHQPVGHRRPLLGAVVLRHGAGRVDGTGHRRRSSAGRSRCSPPADQARCSDARIPPSRSASRSAPRARQGRDKLTLVAAAVARRVRPLGRAADRRKHGKARHRHRADCRRSARRSRRVYGDDRLFVRMRSRAPR